MKRPLFVVVLLAALIYLGWQLFGSGPEPLVQPATSGRPSAQSARARSYQPALPAPLPVPEPEQPGTQDTPALPAIPMWSSQAFEPASDATSSQWIRSATALGTVYLDQSFFHRLKVGLRVRLPVTPPVDYLITDQQPVYGANGTSWMARMVDSHGKQLDYYGVITNTPEILLLTLHTGSGIYYLQSTNKSVAELAFVDYPTLRRAEVDRQSGQPAPTAQ